MAREDQASRSLDLEEDRSLNADERDRMRIQQDRDRFSAQREDTEFVKDEGKRKEVNGALQQLETAVANGWQDQVDLAVNKLRRLGVSSDQLDGLMNQYQASEDAAAAKELTAKELTGEEKQIDEGLDGVVDEINKEGTLKIDSPSRQPLATDPVRRAEDESIEQGLNQVVDEVNAGGLQISGYAAPRPPGRMPPGMALPPPAQSPQVAPEGRQLPPRIQEMKVRRPPGFGMAPPSRRMAPPQPAPEQRGVVIKGEDGRVLSRIDPKGVQGRLSARVERGMSSLFMGATEGSPENIAATKATGYATGLLGAHDITTREAVEMGHKFYAQERARQIQLQGIEAKNKRARIVAGSGGLGQTGTDNLSVEDFKLYDRIYRTSKEQGSKYSIQKFIEADHKINQIIGGLESDAFGQKAALGELIHIITDARATDQDRDFVLGAKGELTKYEQKLNDYVKQGEVPKHFVASIRAYLLKLKAAGSRVRTEVWNNTQNLMGGDPLLSRVSPHTAAQYMEWAPNVAIGGSGEGEGEGAGSGKQGGKGDSSLKDMLEEDED
jgi:hypothetical protein